MVDMTVREKSGKQVRFVSRESLKTNEQKFCFSSLETMIVFLEVAKTNEHKNKRT
jgi:hypothetical protein